MIRAAAFTVTATLTVAACALTATRPANNNGDTPDTTTTTVTVPLAPLPDQTLSATASAPAVRHEALQLTEPPAPPTTVALPTDPEAIIRAVWPDGPDEDYAVLIAWRESGHQPTARNSCCHGLFQIHWTAHRGWLDDYGIHVVADLYDPWRNTRAALALRQRSGWSPWSTHR